MQGNGRQYWDAQVVMTPLMQSHRTVASVTAPYDGNALDITVMVYCQNAEAYIMETLLNIVEAMKAVGKSYEIIVMDDLSKDTSIERVRQFIRDYADLPVMLIASRSAKGEAQHYVDAAFLGRGQYLALLYADNAQPMETLADMFKTAGEADVIVPYYVSAGGEMQDIHPFVRYHMRAMNLFCRTRINDYSGTPMHLRHNVMRWHGDARGPGYHTDLLFRVLELGFTYKQVPCRTVKRRHHQPETGWRDIMSLTHVLFDLLFRKVARRIYR